MRDFLFVQSKELIRTRHLLILTLMNVREDKMTYEFGLKVIQVLCVPVLFRIIRRTKREYILFDVVEWVVQLNNYKHDIRNSKRSFPYSLCRIRTRDSQSIKERALYYSLFNFILVIHNSWCSELITSHFDKTKILNSTTIIFKGRNLSLLNLFCRH